MSTREDIEAKNLAEWLDGRQDLELSDDVAPAIYAIRPDLSPKPRVSLDDVLARVQMGPFSKSSDKTFDDTPSEEDEFVSNLFAVARHPESPKTTLDDVLERVQTGPFVDVKTTDAAPPIEFNTVPTAANNNRWWTSPWLGMGVAVALVLVILLPNNFQAPQHEESIFAPTFEAEEPPLEEIDAGGYLERTTPKTPDRKSISAKPSPAKSVLKERNDDVESNAGVAPETPVESSESKPIDTFESASTPRTLTTKSEPVSELKKLEVEVPSSKEGSFNEDPLEMDDSVAERQTVPMDMDIKETFNEGEGRKDFLEEDVTEAEMEPTIETEDMAVDAVELSAAQAPMSRAQSVEEISQSRDGVIDGMRSNRRARGTNKSKAMAPAAEAIPAMADASTVASQMDSLPSTLSDTEKAALRLADIETVLGMCDVQNPTKSLDMLWFAGLNRNSTDAIVLLLRSSDYDHGDTRYLKRNWTRLSQIYAGQGNVQRAQYYQQMADALP